MPVNIPENLTALASLFPVPLYAVGGFVRDSLLGFNQSDIDVASSLPPEKVKSLLSGTEYEVKDGSKKLFTLIIKHGDFSYEYTTFRKDSYTSGHRPISVVAVTDIKEDALRRDFKINAIYYDIKNACLADPLNGIGDLNSKIISTTRAPEDVFGEDGLRLMRLARIASSIGFSIDEKTLDGAKRNALLINEISPERIKDELNKILIADTFYGKQNAQVNGLKILNDIGVLKIILPEITDGIGLEQNPLYHKYDVFGHSLKTVECAPPSIRLAALLHDVAKPYMKINTGRYRGHDKQGSIMARNILTRLRYPLATINEISRLVEIHMFNLNNDARPNTIRKFILNNKDILDKFFLLKYADTYGGGTFTEKLIPSAENIRDEYKKMLDENVPFSVSDLLVDGNDLFAFPTLPPNKRGECLNELLLQCAYSPSQFNTKEKQLKFIDTYTRRLSRGLQS